MKIIIKPCFKGKKMSFSPLIFFFLLFVFSPSFASDGLFHGSFDEDINYLKKETMEFVDQNDIKRRHLQSQQWTLGWGIATSLSWEGVPDRRHIVEITRVGSRAGDVDIRCGDPKRYSVVCSIDTVGQMCSCPIGDKLWLAYSRWQDGGDNTVSGVIRSNGVPVAVGTSKAGSEDTEVIFDVSDFPLSNVEENSLKRIKIMNLPNHGRLRLSGVDVRQYQEIVVGDIGNLTFEPEVNWYGTTSFSWKGCDCVGRFSSCSYLSNSAAVELTISAVNDVPTINDISKTGTENGIITFSITDFTSHFIDPDGDNLTKIRVTNLPEHGVLKLSEVIVEINQEIVVEDLGNLTFEPEVDWYGTTSFSWEGFDGELYSSNTATVELTISVIISKSGIEDTILTFNATDFINHFAGSEDHVLEKIRIISLPSHGILKLSGITVVINQEIVAGSLGNLVFIPDENWNGNTNFSFNWKRSDEELYSDNMAAVELTISAVNDVPTISDISKTGTKDEVITFSITDFTNHFIDPDANNLTVIYIMSLPEYGVLKLSGENVIQGQEITVGNLENLTFEPNGDWFKTTSFNWRGVNEKLSLSNSAKVNIDIIPSNSGSNTLKPSLRLLGSLLSVAAIVAF